MPMTDTTALGRTRVACVALTVLVGAHAAVARAEAPRTIADVREREAKLQVAYSDHPRTAFCGCRFDPRTLATDSDCPVGGG